MGDAAAIRITDDESLRACGLSRPKIRYLRALSQADVDFAVLARIQVLVLVAPGVLRQTI